MKPLGSKLAYARCKAKKPEPKDTSSFVDPIVAELHAIRQQLHDEYNGDLNAYSLAATANALALGFKFAKSKAAVSAAAAENSDATTAKFDMTNLASQLSCKGDAVAEQRAQRDAW